MSTTVSPQLTAYARRYGLSSLEPWRSQGKSALTPLEFPISSPGLSNAEIFENLILQGRQWELLSGFEMRELESSGCISKEETRVGDLQNGIHPLYQQDRWVQVTEPVQPGMPSHLDPSDPTIFAALKPVLKLASRFLYCSDVWVWFDGLLKGPRRILSPACSTNDGGPAATRLYSFSTRPPEVFASDVEDRKRQFEKLARVFYMRIYGVPGRTGSYAVTRSESDREGMFTKSVLNLRPGIVTQLCRQDMSTSQRLMFEGFLALVIVHETCHAITNFADYEIRGVPRRFEPFFEDEAISEVGHSAINAVLGGVPQSTYPFPPDPLIFVCLAKWPSFEDFKDGKKNPGRAVRYRFHERFGLSAEPKSSYSPIQIRWFEALQTEAYWAAHVLPMQTVRPDQMVVRGFVKSGQSETDGYIRRSFWPENIIAGSHYYDWLANDECPAVPPLPNLPPNPDMAAQAANNDILRQLSEQISNALRSDRIAQRALQNPAAAEEADGWQTVMSRDGRRKNQSRKVPDTVD